MYPVASKFQGAAETDTLIVDIGGGAAHDVIAFKKKFPGIKGRVIVEDLPGVLETIKNLPAGITTMAHDFFQPQPVKGAKVYYMRQILHDWPDKQAKIILEHIRDAMNEESVLIVHDATFPDQNVSYTLATVDFCMMSLLSGAERTQKHFEELFDSAGLKIAEIRKPEAGLTVELGMLLEVVRK